MHKSLCRYIPSFLLSKYTGIGLLGHMVMTQILRRCQSKWPHYFAFLATLYEGYNCSISLPTLGFISLFNFSHPGVYIVVYHLVLSCISLMTNDFEHLFMYLFAIHVSSLIKCPHLLQFLLCHFLLFVELKETFMYSEYKFFHQVYFCKYFSQPVSCLFIFIMVLLKSKCL